MRDTCRTLGLCDEVPKAPLFIDVLCDASVGSSCARDTLGKVMGELLQEVAERPKSHVRLWMLQKTVADTGVLGEQVVPQHRRGALHARRAQAARFAASATEYFATVAAPAFAAPPIRRSTLAEAIAKVALADAGKFRREFIVVTDGREVSGLHDFECGCLPSEARFLSSLRKRALLTPGSLKNVSVHFAFMQSAPIPSRGCTVQIDRELRIRALWTAALSGAGASDLEMSSGLPRLENDDHAQQENP